MLWLKTSGRAPITVRSASSSTPRKSGVSTSTEQVGQLRLQRAHRGREVTRATVGEVVAVDGGDDDVVEPQLRRRLREPQRLERVGRAIGLARVDVAVPAGAGAGVAEDLERGGPAPPALGDVRTARLLAHGVQAGAVEELLDVEVASVGARRAHLHPLGAPRALGDGQRRLHSRQSTLRTGSTLALLSRAGLMAGVAKRRCFAAAKRTPLGCWRGRDPRERITTLRRARALRPRSGRL